MKSGFWRLERLCTWAWRVMLSALLFTPAAVLAGDILSGRLYTVPEKVYVNQAFEIHFELEVTFGSEVDDLRISNFPNDPALINVGKLETLSRDRVSRDTKTVDVLHFSAPARCFKSVDQTFSPSIQCMLVERRNNGFFSQWQSYPKTKQLAPFALKVLPLPEAGRPDSFSGAIGSFRLTGHVSPTRVQPGDIVTLSLDLIGKGWLGEASMPTPSATPAFKAYPVKERLREPLHLQTDQVLIPQSTNALEIGALRFTYFNPATERYEESAAGPFKLTFDAAAEKPKVADVQVIDTTVPLRSEAQPQVVTLARVNQTLRQLLPLIAGCAGALAAFFAFFMLYGQHKRLAFACALLLLAGGIGTGHALSGRKPVETVKLARQTDVLFAPSRAAAVLFPLNPGSAVTPLEHAGAWIRVDAAGRRGWIPSDAIAPEPSAH